MAMFNGFSVSSPVLHHGVNGLVLPGWVRSQRTRHAEGLCDGPSRAAARKLRSFRSARRSPGGSIAKMMVYKYLFIYIYTYIIYVYYIYALYMVKYIIIYIGKLIH